MKKTECRNLCCKHHQTGNTCGTTLQIGANGQCQSFEKSLLYYFRLVLSALVNKNYIDATELTEEMKLGTCRMSALNADEKGPILKTEDIYAIELDQEAVDRLSQELEEGILTRRCGNPAHSSKPSQPFGWLSPTGTFTEGDFGEHDAVAREIIRKKGRWNDFRAWNAERNGTCRDFLSEVAGYCLIHNPSGYGGYIVSNSKPLTKKQKDFLFAYFMEIGDRFKAEQFVDTGV